MVAQFARNWWWLALRGVAAMLFGILAFIWPGITFLALVLLFGAYALVDGVFAIIAAFTNRAGHDRWWVLLLEGLVSVAAGLITLFFLGLAAFALLIVIAAWAIVTGVLEIAAAIRLRQEIKGEVLLALSGIASVIFAILLFLNPITGSIVVVWIIGAYAIVFGALLFALAWRMRDFGARKSGKLAGTA